MMATDDTALIRPDVSDADTGGRSGPDQMRGDDDRGGEGVEGLRGGGQVALWVGTRRICDKWADPSKGILSEQELAKALNLPERKVAHIRRDELIADVDYLKKNKAVQFTFAGICALLESFGLKGEIRAVDVAEVSTQGPTAEKTLASSPAPPPYPKKVSLRIVRKPKNHRTLLCLLDEVREVYCRVKDSDAFREGQIIDAMQEGEDEFIFQGRAPRRAAFASVEQREKGSQEP